MSIKGASQELFVGKKDSKIIDLFGNSTKISYSDLKKIEYCYFQIVDIWILFMIQIM